MNGHVRLRKASIVISLILALCGQVSVAAEAFEWQTVSPASQGFSTGKLDALRDSLARRGTKALLIVRNDKIVYEWYAPGHGPEKKH